MSSSSINGELHVAMQNGEVWSVPISVIAAARARHYATEFGGDVARSLKEDTIPLFESSEREIVDWAEGNMDWSDVQSFARRVNRPPPAGGYQEGWMNGEKKVVRQIRKVQQ